MTAAPSRQVLPFHPKHLEAVLEGTKDTTVRWQEDVEVGPTRFQFGGGANARSLEGRVVSVQTHHLSQLTAAAAHHPPGTDMADFVHQLRANYYPSMPDDTHVQVVTFALAVPHP